MKFIDKLFGRKEPDPIDFTLLFTSDEHSSLIPHSPALAHVLDNAETDTKGGFARLSTKVEEVKQESDEPVFLVSSGDFLTGTPFGWLSLYGQSPSLEVMKAIGYDAVGLGNHEFDYGVDVLADCIEETDLEKTTLIGSNLSASKGSKLVEGKHFKKSHIVKKGDLSLGFVSCLGEDAVNIILDLDEVEFNKQAKALKKISDNLKKEGADLVVALVHGGLEEAKELAKIKNVDVIVSGHTHVSFSEPVKVKGTYIVQAGFEIEQLGKVEFSYLPDGELRIKNEDQSCLIPIDSNIEEDTKIVSLVEKYSDLLSEKVANLTNGKYQSIFDVVTHCDFEVSHQPPLAETPVGNFVTDAMRVTTQKLLNKKVDIAIQANGSIRKSITPDKKTNKISFYDLVSAVGLRKGETKKPGDSIISFYLKGEEVRQILEIAVLVQEFIGNSAFLQFSGLRYSYNPADAVLFKIPIFEQAVPSADAVNQIEIYKGDGPQPSEGEEFESLKKNRLYHVITSFRIFRLALEIQRLHPRLNLSPKKKDGSEIPKDNLNRLIIKRDGQEFKVWEAILDYADSWMRKGDNLQIPDYYQTGQKRINPLK